MPNFSSGFEPHRVLSLTFTALAVCVLSASAQSSGERDGDPGHGHGHGHEKHHNKSNPKPPDPHTPQLSMAAASAAEAVVTYSQTAAHALEQGSLVDRAGHPLPARTQLELLDVLSDRGAPVDRLAAALAPECNRQARGEAVKVAQSLRGLAEDPTRLRKAAEAYNRFIGSSSAAFLAEPPPELLAVQAVLTPMVERAMAASGSSGSDLAAQ